MKTLTLILVIGSLSIASGQPVEYPLHTGDRWVFNPSLPFIPTPESVSGDTLMSNGMRYAVIHYRNNFGFQRHAGPQVFQFDPETQSEYLWCDFSRSPGDTVNTVVRDNDTLDITLYSYRIAALFDVNRRQWMFLFDARGVIDEEQLVEITDSLGTTSIFMNSGSVDLRGAVINGVVYGDPTGIDEPLDGITKDFQLAQNYPNPFNPSTKIVYRVGSRELIELKIFDVLGREVATLVNEVNEVKEPGAYEVTWDASGVAGGIYFYRLQSGSFTAVKKMVVLR